MPVYNYTTIDDPGATQGTVASGINDAGQIVGTYLTGAGVHGFVDSGGTFTTLDDPSGIKTFATGINSAGHIVGYYTDSGGHDHAFFFSGGFDTLNNPLGTNVEGNDFYAEGINDLGWMVGAFSDANDALFGFLTGNGVNYTFIRDPLGVEDFGVGSQVLGTSYNAAKGLIYNVGSYFDSAFHQHGFFNDFFSGTYTTIDNPLGTNGT